MRRKLRRDQNHGQIAEAWRKLGWSVSDTSICGESGFPDLVIAKRPYGTHLCEVKVPKGKLRDSQTEFQSRWPFPVLVCRSVDDVMAAHERLMTLRLR